MAVSMQFLASVRSPTSASETMGTSSSAGKEMMENMSRQDPPSPPPNPPPSPSRTLVLDAAVAA